MRAAPKAFRTFVADQRGATSVEYVVIAMCIFLAIVTGLTAIGTRLAGIFPVISSRLE
jgi:pilus assembly protein Flp/PilA